MKYLNFELKFGVEVDEDVHTKVALLKTNGVAEKVFTDKFPEKPYTWMAHVISVATASIGDVKIGVNARKEYVDTGSIHTLSPAVTNLCLQEVNSLTIEIHRRVWRNLLPEQEVLCKHCGAKSLMTIDLSKIDYTEKDMEKFYELTAKGNRTLTVDLPEGLDYSSPKIYGTEELKNPHIDGLSFNRFYYRIPTLQDCMNNERHSSDSIKFWRQIAFDCFIKAESVDEEGAVLGELSKQDVQIFGMTLYNETLYKDDLKAIRETLRECVPTLPFYYEDTCPNCKRDTPVNMEPSNFFSE